MSEFITVQPVENWEDTLQFNESQFFNALHEKGFKYSADHQKIKEIISWVKNQISDLNQDMDKRFLLGNWSWSHQEDRSETYKDAISVNEQDYDAALREIQSSMQETIQAFVDSEKLELDNLAMSMNELLNVQGFSHLVPKTDYWSQWTLESPQMLAEEKVQEEEKRKKLIQRGENLLAFLQWE